MPTQERSSLTVWIASKNPVKIEAGRRGFEKVFPESTVHVGSMNVPSGVSDQPKNDQETFEGARNRARNARNFQPSGDFWVGMEGGLEEHEGGLMAGAWIYILGREGQGRSRTANFLLPDPISRRIREGLELGTAIDQVFDRRGAKRGPGAAGLLTDGAIGRTDLYEPAVILALAPFRKQDLYAGSEKAECI